MSSATIEYLTQAKTILNRIESTEIENSVASQYAPRGIRAKVICPSLTATPMS
jgi:hypothetical protein